MDDWNVQKKKKSVTVDSYYNWINLISCFGRRIVFRIAVDASLNTLRERYIYKYIYFGQM